MHYSLKGGYIKCQFTKEDNNREQNLQYNNEQETENPNLSTLSININGLSSSVKINFGANLFKVNI